MVNVHKINAFQDHSKKKKLIHGFYVLIVIQLAKNVKVVLIKIVLLVEINIIYYYCLQIMIKESASNIVQMGINSFTFYKKLFY